jgi:nascent polypeptide-associated complex subunit alpha
MIPGLDPSKMKKLMKMMKAQQIDVREITFIMDDGSKMKIRDPQVTKMNVMGNDVFQVQGELEEEKISEDDMKIVMEKASVSQEKAKKALEEAGGDIAKAILNLKG